MATELRLPRMSDEMQEGTVSRWLKQEGDAVAKGDPLVEVETEKVIVEVEATISGVLLEIVAREQEIVPVDGVLCLIGKQGEKPRAARSSLEKQPGQPASNEAARPAASNVVPLVQTSPPAVAQSAVAQSVHETAAVADAVVTPLARRVARELGIDLAEVQGSGIGGKIIMSDLQPYMAGGKPEAADPAVRRNPPAARLTALPTRSPVAQPVPGPTALSAQGPTYTDVPHSPMRGTVARRMAESKAGIPHFYMTIEIDMAACLAKRDQLNEKMSGGRISMNDVMVKAAAAALMKVPELNAEYTQGAVRRYAVAHIGFAVAIDEGLVTPVLRDCHAKGIGTIARESAQLIEKAKSRALRPEDMQGGTFTISNLGMHEVVEFSAIINPPQVGILAIARPVERPVVKNGWVVISPRLNATLSADHRAVDGVTGAAFLTAFKTVLEDPEQMLL